jgi:hypothetical protein
MSSSRDATHVSSLWKPAFPFGPVIGLLLRLVYQHGAQDIHAGLGYAGFGDIGPAHANVVPFETEDGITVSELAHVARVRKRTMARPLGSSGTWDTCSAAPTRATVARGCVPHRTWRIRQAGHARDRGARRAALGADDWPCRARGTARRAAALAHRAQGAIAPTTRRSHEELPATPSPRSAARSRATRTFRGCPIGETLTRSG